MDKENRMHKLYNDFLDSEGLFYMVVVGLISADSNMTELEMKKNLSMINDFLEVSESYMDNEQNLKYRKKLLEGQKILEKDLEKIQNQ